MTDQPRWPVRGGVSKRFSGVQALDDVSVSFPAGSVTALMGENGAGKSTLLRIIGGDHQPDGGALELDGVGVRSPRPARRTPAGVRVIAQEPEILPDVNGGRERLPGPLPRRGRMLDRRALNTAGAGDLARLGFERALEPTTLGRDLSAAQRQLVEILRALTSRRRCSRSTSRRPRCPSRRSSRCFALIRRLRDHGLAIIYVSHRLKEVFDIADRDRRSPRRPAGRDGRAVADTTEAEVVRLMVGRDLSSMFARDQDPGRQALLEVRGAQQQGHPATSR